MGEEATQESFPGSNAKCYTRNLQVICSIDAGPEDSPEGFWEEKLPLL